MLAESEHMLDTGPSCPAVNENDGEYGEEVTLVANQSDCCHDITGCDDINGLEDIVWCLSVNLTGDITSRDDITGCDDINSLVNLSGDITSREDIVWCLRVGIYQEWKSLLTQIDPRVICTDKLNINIRPITICISAGAWLCDKRLGL
nr:hypothetical protein BaRGS_011974 [Batillaria attramentaria]